MNHNCTNYYGYTCIIAWLGMWVIREHVGYVILSKHTNWVTYAKVYFWYAICVNVWYIDFFLWLLYKEEGAGREPVGGGKTVRNVCAFILFI